MKKIIAISSCFIMLLGITGCQDKEVAPSEVTKLFLDGYHEKDAEKIKQNSDWTDFNVKTLEVQEEDFIEGVDKALQKDVYQMTLDFKHKESDEKIDGDKASVKVEMTIYDFDPVIEQGMNEATKKVVELSKKSDISDAQAQAEIANIVFTNMKKAKMDKKESITVYLVKKHKAWVVSNDNKALKDVLSKNTKSLKNFGV